MSRHDAKKPWVLYDQESSKVVTGIRIEQTHSNSEFHLLSFVAPR